ncbi:ferritin-like domain-containing protein [uncultured Sphingomonas sp.]|uniref:ferritin-like domain-containing protein n=1 Tax=uncultured Sphingomonas sp. TaxID=158754 RepID=UPI002585AAB7|nr:ferritin-like domain-containing protein [uncultured Sphingomonas sp.]
MTDETQMVAALDARARRREERRDFFRAFGAVAAVGTGLALTSCGGNSNNSPTPTPSGSATATPTPTPSATGSSGFTDNDVLNFALNLEYLEAQFYAFAANGTGLASTLLTGSGTAGTVTGGRKANLNDPIVANYAREIAQDELAHVEFLRNALGSSAIAMPTLDISATPTSAFSNAARAAGLIGQGATFDPYENDDNFLLAAYLFEDVGVTAYRGAIGGLANALIRQVASGILAAEAYHAAMIRSAVFMRGLTTPTLIEASEAISKARDDLDGQSDIDQGVRPIGDRSNIMPFDATTGLPYGRTTGQVLNIAYLNRNAVTTGGFFPAGVNGAIKSSAAN